MVVTPNRVPGPPGAPTISLQLPDDLLFVPAAPTDPGVPAFSGYAGTVDTGGGAGPVETIPADGLTVPCTSLGQVTTFEYWAVNDAGSSTVVGPITSTACPSLPIISTNSPAATKTRKSVK